MVDNSSTSSEEKILRRVRFESPLRNERHKFDIDSDDCDSINLQKCVEDVVDDDADLNLQRRQRRLDEWIPLAQMGAAGVVLILSMLVIFGGRYSSQRFTKQKMLAHSTVVKTPNTLNKFALWTQPNVAKIDDTSLCSKTCRLRLVESIPQNLTFATAPKSMCTFDAWLNLIESAEHTLTIAAYKSSLRGKHVFGNTKQHFSSEGEKIYTALMRAGLQRKVNIRILENSPSKDKGDNEDARDLKEMGAITRRQLNLQRLNGAGVMHSKFIIADRKNFYLGSANLDWRSLNQKMEMGVLVSNCACLARDLNSLFELYWRLSFARDNAEASVILKDQATVQFGAANPLQVKIQSRNAEVFLAASPLFMNAPNRVWDLDAILNAINSARTHLLINVMDYIPVFIYSKEKPFWPAIDDAIRNALSRGVKVKLLTAALHYPKISMRFLESLDALNKLYGAGSIEIKVLKVPSSPHLQSVIKRDRRTHKKFLVTDDRAVIGTSNWSGDYFEGGTTGTAIVIHQNDNISSAQTLLEEIRDSFARDWHSVYAHPLRKYIDHCIDVCSITHTHHCIFFKFTLATAKSFPDFCEPEKDKKLFAKTSVAAH